MNDLQDKRKKAQELRMQKKYSEALPIYRELWESNVPKDKWDGWGYALCLNNLKDYTRAYEVSKKVYEIDPSFDYNKGQFAWSSYLANIKDYPDDGATDKLEEFVHEVIKVTDGKGNELFRDQATLKMMDHLTAKNAWIKIIEWSKYIKPDDLSIKPFNGVSSDGKKFRKPSDKESYYLKMAKALERANKLEECIELCNTALEIFPEETWFKWHKASSLRKLKNYDDAISLLEEVKKQKRDWFVLRDLAATYYGKKDYETAYTNFLEATVSSLNIPKPENRWELFYMGAKILYKKDENEIADKHIALTFKLREETGWKIQDFLEKDIFERNIHTGNSSSELLKELKQICQCERFAKAF